MKEGIYMKQKTGLQMSSSLPVMILLNLSGGTQDACSYFLRDHVFANAQTGHKYPQCKKGNREKIADRILRIFGDQMTPH